MMQMTLTAKSSQGIKEKGTRGDAAHSSLVLSVEWDMEGEGWNETM